MARNTFEFTVLTAEELDLVLGGQGGIPTEGEAELAAHGAQRAWDEQEADADLFAVPNVAPRWR
jgi:hypothetical protein